MRYFCEKCKYEKTTHTDKICPRCGGLMLSVGLPPGSVVAGFKIIGELGRGANGVVYRALQASLNREVALKILADVKTRDTEFIDNFFKEVRAAAKLNHQNIVQAFDAGSTPEGIYYFAMEMADGGTLDKYISEHGALPIEKAIETALTIARALNYAWEEQNMFHGDVKPENILFTRNGEVKLADFGLAKSSGEIGAEDIMATPMYAPPEVIVGNKAKIGIKSDMYSFGVSLYEMLTGAPPFDEADPRRVLDLHLKEKHTPLAEKLIYIYPDLSELIDRLLNKNPDARPASWQEIINTLQQVGKEPILPPVPQKQPVNRAALLFLIPVVTVFCVILGFVLWGILSFGRLAYDGDAQPTARRYRLESPDKLAAAAEDETSKQPSTAGEQPKPSPQPHEEIARLREKYQEAVERFANAASGEMSVAAINRVRHDLRRLATASGRNGLSEALTGKQIEQVDDMRRQLEQKIDEHRKVQSASRIAELRASMSRERQETAKTSQDLSASEFDPETVAGYFRILDTFFGLPVERRTRTGLIRSMSEASLEKLLPELREKISFIETRLPQRAEILEIFADTREGFKGLPLPWEIDGLSYETLDIDSEGIRLVTKLSKGAYSRRRLEWHAMSFEQQQALLVAWLGGRQFPATPQQLSELAAVVFARAEYPLPPEIARLLNTQERQRWLELKNDVADIPTELAAATGFAGFRRAVTADNRQELADFIKEFRQKYRNTMVGRLAEKQFVSPERWLRLFSPQTVAETALADLEQSGISVFTAMSAVAAVCRYGELKQVDSNTRNTLQQLQNRILQEVEAVALPTQLDYDYGFWGEIAPGDIWRSSRPQTARELQSNPLPFCPALLDIGDWRALYDIVGTPDSRLWPEKAGIARFQPEYPALLYALGIVAARKDRKRLEATIADLRDYAQRRNESGVLAMAADLALRGRDAPKALELIANMRLGASPTTAELAAVYCRLRATLLSLEIDETDYRHQVDSALQRLKPLASANGHDLSPLSVSARLVDGIDEIDPAHITLQATHAYQAALLLADTGARNIMLELGGITHDQLSRILQPQNNASAFRSELAWRLFLLQLTAAPFTPARLLHVTESELQKREPATTPFYPELIMLNVAGGILNGDLASDQAQPIIAAFLDNGAVFPGNSSDYATNMRASRFLHVADSETAAKRELLPLGILALSAARQNERREILRTLHDRSATMIWPERLLLQRFSELISIME